MASRTTRVDRGSATRDMILDTAERLFAERGLHTVSNRQVSDASGQGNSAAVGYHFGTKADLVRAIARRHSDDLEKIRVHMVAEAAGSADIRDWVACLVRPFTEHLAALETPTWYARFCTQVNDDPQLRDIMIDEALTSSSLPMLLVGLHQCIPDMPASVREQRLAMARHVTSQMCAERECAIAAGARTLQDSWEDLANSLVDAISGLWLAPVTRYS
jgi:AcrR family transcriptional regulator